MEKEQEELVLSKLKEILQDAPISHYCFFGVKEDATCLNRSNEWEVYYVERGIKRDEESFNNIVEAGIAMIRRVFVLDKSEEHVNLFINGIIK